MIRELYLGLGRDKNEKEDLPGLVTFSSRYSPILSSLKNFVSS